MSVYLMEAVGSGRIKIGYTENIKARESAIAGSSPFPIVVLSVREGGRRLESAMHDALAESRVYREWFLKPEGVENWFLEFDFHGEERVAPPSEIVYPTPEELENKAAQANLTMTSVFSAANVGRESFYREKRGDGKMLPRTALALGRAIAELSEKAS